MALNLSLTVLLHKQMRIAFCWMMWMWLMLFKHSNDFSSTFDKPYCGKLQVHHVGTTSHISKYDG
jgi:hypothetical protein